jgi:hypothetical protein
MRNLILALMLWPAALAAQEADKTFTLAAPAELSGTGLLGYIVPRFALKTATRVRIVAEDAEADATFGSDGAVAFEGLGQIWKLAVGDDPDAMRFADWLQSEVGRTTVDGFTVDGAALFSSEVKVKAVVVPVGFDGDARRGATLALELCGRCHVVSEANRHKSIGSTPSFAVLRTLPGWDSRFQGFYALNPHPAFTQVAEVTPPFDKTRPSPIAPVEVTLDQIEDILAFVAGVSPAELGAPVQSQ